VVPRAPEADEVFDPSIRTLNDRLKFCEQEDPIVEYEDEFGRMRTAPRSEVPRHLVPASGDGQPDDDEYVTLVYVL
jgi:hypothetical protein